MSISLVCCFWVYALRRVTDFTFCITISKKKLQHGMIGADVKNVKHQRKWKDVTRTDGGRMDEWRQVQPIGKGSLWLITTAEKITITRPSSSSFLQGVPTDSCVIRPDGVLLVWLPAAIRRFYVFKGLFLILVWRKMQFNKNERIWEHSRDCQQIKTFINNN